MPRRDPQTGQFVSGSGGGSLEYDDLDVQALEIDASIPAANLAGGTGETGGSAQEANSILDWEPLGGLSRGEVAELVALEWEAPVYINSTQTADGTVRAMAEIGFDSRAGVALDVVGPSMEASDGNSTINVDSTPADDTDFDMLTSIFGVAHGPITDGTNGVGGAGSAANLSKRIDYAEAIGSGPVLDRHSEMHLAQNFVVWNVSDAAVHQDHRINLFWNVFEE